MSFRAKCKRLISDTVIFIIYPYYNYLFKVTTATNISAAGSVSLTKVEDEATTVASGSEEIPYRIRRAPSFIIYSDVYWVYPYFYYF